MRHLLDASLQRIVNTLEILIMEEDWITAGELAARIGASERTVVGDIVVLKKRWGQYLDIEVSTKKGIRARNRSVAMLGRICMEVFNESTALRWIEEILFHPLNGIEFHEERLFVSRSTLIRALPRINRFLGEKGLRIRSKNNRYELAGEDEQYLREFCAGLLLEMHGLDLRKFQIEPDLETAGRIVGDIICRALEPREAACCVNDGIVLVYNMVFCTVSLLRESQGYAAPCRGGTPEAEISDADFERIRNSFPNIRKENLRPIHEFIRKRFCGWDSEEEKALVARESEALFERLFRAAEIVPDPELVQGLSFLLRMVYLTAKLRPYETSALFDRIRYFSAYLEKHNGALYRLFEENLELFSRHIYFDMSPRLHDLLFWVCLAYPEFGGFSPLKHALVVSDFSPGHADYLARFIAAFFNGSKKASISVTAAYLPEVQRALALRKYDLVISTVPDLQMGRGDLVLINDYPSYENFCAIYKKLHQ